MGHQVQQPGRLRRGVVEDYLVTEDHGRELGLGISDCGNVGDRIGGRVRNGDVDLVGLRGFAPLKVVGDAERFQPLQHLQDRLEGRNTLIQVNSQPSDVTSIFDILISPTQVRRTGIHNRRPVAFFVHSGNGLIRQLHVVGPALQQDADLSESARIDHTLPQIRVEW